MKLKEGIADLRAGQKCRKSHSSYVFLLTRILLDQESQLRDRESRDIIAWLSSLNFSAKQNDVFSKQHSGTGRWFLENDIFKAWINGHQKALWCPGIRMTSPCKVSVFFLLTL